MQHLFVKYETALALKEAGFNEPCSATYSEGRLYPCVQTVDTLINIFHADASEYEGYGQDDHVFITYVPDFEEFKDVGAPIHLQAIDWLDDKGLLVDARRTEIGFFCVVDDHQNHMMYPVGTIKEMKLFETRYQAMEAGIMKALELLKKQDTDGK